jgi:hypothetical protein
MNGKPEWQTVQEYVKGNGLVVRVQKLDLYKGPKFTIQIGVPSKNDPKRLTPYLPVHSTARGKVQVNSYWADLSEAVREAEHFIEQELQVHEDLYIEQAQERESRQLDRDKPKQRRGIGSPGKTARNREKKRRRLEA